MKILVVDDDPLALSLIEAALGHYGFHDVLTANSGIDALKELECAVIPVECFLLDVRMPEMDGIELCARIRKYERYATAPILFISAVSDRARINNAYAAGAVDFVSKPIDPMEIGIRVSVAEKLVLEEQQSRKNRQKANAIEAQLTSILKFSINDPVPISDIPRVVSKLAFENYLLGLGRGKIYNSTVTAFAIKDIEPIFSKATPTEMFYFLTDIADAISTSLRGTDFLLTYYGYGEYVCVTKRTDASFARFLEQAINAEISRLDLEYGDGTPCYATVIMGQAVQPTVWTTSDPLKLVNAAMETLENRPRDARTRAALGAKKQAYSSPILNL